MRFVFKSSFMKHLSSTKCVLVLAVFSCCSLDVKKKSRYLPTTHIAQTSDNKRLIELPLWFYSGILLLDVAFIIFKWRAGQIKLPAENKGNARFEKANLDADWEQYGIDIQTVESVCPNYVQQLSDGRTRILYGKIIEDATNQECNSRVLELIQKEPKLLSHVRSRRFDPRQNRFLEGGITFGEQLKAVTPGLFNESGL